jgi:hypothetical protein
MSFLNTIKGDAIVTMLTRDLPLFGSSGPFRFGGGAFCVYRFSSVW